MRSVILGLVCGLLAAIEAYWIQVRTIRRGSRPGHLIGVDLLSVLKLGRREATIAGSVLFLAGFLLAR